ncbi:MAG: DUF1538 domain-containing protein [Christensenellaceae bacterium]|jgi:hypothetical protein|nr:DUF1538 domain-containing protein [Christensenellaceae bacterium]
MKNFLIKYLKELKSVMLSSLPIIFIIFAIHIYKPMPDDLFFPFLISIFILIFGQALFLVGINGSIIAMGEFVGSNINKLKKLFFILLFGFIFGTLATIAEPSVSIITKQVENATGAASILTTFVVSSGVGIFVAYALLRIFLELPLRLSFLICYGIVFTLLFFSPPEFRAITLDFSGATTGAVTVPFVLSIGIGVSSILNKSNNDNSYGLIGLASIGPIITMSIMAIIFGKPTSDLQLSHETVEFLPILGNAFTGILIALSPIAGIFLIFNFFFIHLPRSKIFQILLGTILTMVGIGLFITAVDFGFAEAARYLGETIPPPILIPFGLLLGFALGFCEPDIKVLGNQIEKNTNGKIKSNALVWTLAIGLAFAVGLAMLRLVYKLDILFIVLPVFIIALAVTPFIPKLFVGIAFDSGGVVSGTITGAFVVPFAAGVCMNIDIKDNITFGFGIIALIATVPIIAISILGLIYQTKLNVQKELITSTSWRQGEFYPYQSVNFLGIVCKQSVGQHITDMLAQNNVFIITQTNAHGLSRSLLPTSMFNFTQESQTFLLAIVDRTKAKQIIQTLEVEFEFNRPNSGIAFSGYIGNILGA